MSRNGSGVYSLPAGNPVVTGTTISSTWANNTMSDLANALTGSVASDGQTAMTGNLQMGNNKITGLANGSNAQDAVTYSQLTGLAPATSGSSVLAGNGSGGFTNVSLATGLTYSGGTLTADINTLLPSQSGKSGYVLTTDGSVTSWGTAGGSGTVTSVAVSGGTTGLTTSGGPVTSSGTITIAGTLAVTAGGTGSTTADGALTNLLPAQTSQSGKFLTTNGSTTSWASAGTGTVTSVALSAGTTGLSVSGSPITTSGTMTLSGTLAVANGGTGVTTSTGSGSNVLSTSPTLSSPTLTTPVLGTPSSGTLTNCTSLPIVAGTTGTLTVARGGTGVTVQPKFSAHSAVTQNVTSATWTKVTLGTENFDTNSNFATSRFTPTVAGYYMLTGTIRANPGASSTANTSICSVYKNGSEVQRGNEAIGSGTGYQQPTVTTILYMNGSTDYVELYGYISTNAGTPSFYYDSDVLSSYFTGTFVGA
jgi:hypothetical protein